MKALCVSAARRWVVAALLVAACSTPPPPEAPSPHAIDAALLARLTDPGVASPERIERILAEGRPGNVAAIPTLRAVLSDKSQTAFVLVPSKTAAWGLVVAENPSALPVERGPERAMAVIALESIGSWRALADVLHAIDDRDGLTAVHAARAALRFGSRAGIPRLITALERKAYESETANRMLVDMSGVDFGFDADIGMQAKAEAVAKWRAWWKERAKDPKPLVGEGPAYRMGLDPVLDERIRTEVDIVGQFQFLFMEQSRRMLARLGASALPFVEEGLVRAADKPTWRAGLAQALAGMDLPEARVILRRLAKDPFPSVRSRSVEALVAVEGEEGVSVFADALRDSDPSIPLAALRAAGAARRTDVLVVLEAARFAVKELDEASKVARFRIRRDSRDVAAIMDQVANGLPGGRAAALEALAEVYGVVLPDDATVDDRVRAAFLEEVRVRSAQENPPPGR